jgi:hypothetical protein
VKRSAMGGSSLQTLFGLESSLWCSIVINNDFFGISDSIAYFRYSTNLLRDPSAWYHLVCTFDTTQAIASNRVKLYINGTEVSYAGGTIPAQNYDGGINTTDSHWIGRVGATNGRYFDGYLADIHFIDGQALDPTSFGEFDATTGVWMPKAFSGGSYGTNGFKLDFSDNSAATATTLGKDSSGNGNNFTPSNLSVTAGAANDSLVDVPTNGSEVDTGSGGQVRGNYCTGNPLAIGGGTLSNGNLDYVRVSDPSGNTCGKVLGTIATTSGKWYFEYTIATSSASSAAIGITSNIQGTISAIGGTNYVGIGSYEYVWRAQGQTINNGSFPSYGTAASNGDTIMCAFDVDAGKVWFGRNGTWFNSSNPSAGTSPAFAGFSGTVMPIFGIGTASAGFDANGSINFGQRPFAYTAPSGFKALCTANLPAPVVTKPSEYMDVLLYTGNGSTQTISGLGFSPDFLWFKTRNTNSQHALYDVIRGVSKSLVSNSTAAEATEGGGLASFDSAGFSLSGDNTIQGSTNGSGRTYVTWAWDAGSSTVTNTQGSISSQVRANASAGFSIVSYTGNGAAANIGHGLGVEPHLIIHKFRSASSNWSVYTKATGAGGRLLLNSTAAFSSDGAFPTAPTSSVFYVNSGLNDNGVTIVAYCFAPVAGYSSFGSYVGTGAVSTGPFCYTGFRPRLIILKAAVGGTSGWIMVDTARNTYNAVDYFLQANSSGAESTQVILDSLSNGFVIRPVGDAMNNSGVTFVWAAFAESPFQYARAR